MSVYLPPSLRDCRHPALTASFRALSARLCCRDSIVKAPETLPSLHRRPGAPIGALSRW
eukprot:m.316384 g.316384  ORF g.316384 m.316384 type:complete len:59 (+) comp931430_c0_seq1:98-274(+)